MLFDECYEGQALWDHRAIKFQATGVKRARSAEFQWLLRAPGSKRKAASEEAV